MRGNDNDQPISTSQHYSATARCLTHNASPAGRLPVPPHPNQSHTTQLNQPVNDLSEKVARDKRAGAALGDIHGSQAADRQQQEDHKHTCRSANRHTRAQMLTIGEHTNIHAMHQRS